MSPHFQNGHLKTQFEFCHDFKEIKLSNFVAIAKVHRLHWMGNAVGRREFFLFFKKETLFNGIEFLQFHEMTQMSWREIFPNLPVAAIIQRGMVKLWKSQPDGNTGHLISNAPECKMIRLIYISVINAFIQLNFQFISQL